MHRIDNNDPYRNMGGRTAMGVDVSSKALSVHRNDHNLHTYKAHFTIFAKVNYRTALRKLHHTSINSGIESDALQVMIQKYQCRDFLNKEGYKKLQKTPVTKSKVKRRTYST